MDNIILKIQNSSGLHSTGGVSPTWSKRGKIWTTRSGLSCHFNVMTYERAIKEYTGCTVIEHNLESGKVSYTPATSVIEQWYVRSVNAKNKHKSLD